MRVFKAPTARCSPTAKGALGVAVMDRGLNRLPSRKWQEAISAGAWDQPSGSLHRFLQKLSSFTGAEAPLLISPGVFRGQAAL